MVVGIRQPSENVLVAIMRDRLDFSILRDEGWYRVPVEQAHKLKGRWPPTWIAFYQTKVFGASAYSISYYGRVLEIRRVFRFQLFPDEPRDAQGEREYYQLFVETLSQLPEPIPSRRLRRLVFIPTTLEKLMSATEINDLYDDSPLEDELWQEFKSLRIPAERQERVETSDGNYFLDFAVYCGLGNLDVETDGDTYHSNPEKAPEDNVRDNHLQSRGWRVLRFNTLQVREQMRDYCVPKLIELINLLGGVADGGELPRQLPRKLADGSYQMDMFSDRESEQ